MPTAIEYAVVAHVHEQNGCGGGPPAQEWTGAHGGGASGLAVSVVHPDVVTAAPAEGWLVTGLPVAVLVALAGVLWHRRLGSRSRDKDHVR